MTDRAVDSDGDPGQTRACFGARRRATALAILAAGLPALVLAVGILPVYVLAAPTDRASDRPSAAPPIGRCEIHASSSYAPTHLRVGETVGVTLTLQSECGDTPVNMVLVIDASGSGQMTENVLVWAEDIVEFAIAQMPLARVGIVSYNDGAKLECDLTDDGDALRACIAGIVTGGGKHPEFGLAEAAAMFRRHRSTPPEAEYWTREIAVVLMAGPPDGDCGAALAAASELKNESVLVWPVLPCTGTCNVSCARRIATSPRYFMTNWDGFLAFFDEVTRPLYPYGTVISTTLPVSMSRSTLYEPWPEESGPVLEWSFATPVPNPVTVRYRAYAHRAGTYLVGPSRALVDFRGIGDRRDPVTGRGRHLVLFEPAVIHVTGAVWLPLLTHGR